MPSTLDISVLPTNGRQIPTQLSDEQQQDLNAWYDQQERDWYEQQQYCHDNYLYDDRI